jgi:hypothetical protein
MLQQTAQDSGPLAGHSPEQQRALDGYAILMSAFLGLSGGFSVWMRRTGRSLPAAWRHPTSR